MENSWERAADAHDTGINRILSQLSRSHTAVFFLGGQSDRRVTLNFTAHQGQKMRTPVGNHLLGNVVKDHVRKVVTITLKEKAAKVSKEGTSGPRDCSVA